MFGMSSFWFLIFLSFFAAESVYCNFKNRILYGNIVDPKFYDWSIVEIKYISITNFTGLCTGTLISQRHVLTALHCVQDSKEQIHPKFKFNIIDDSESHPIIHIRSQHVDIAIIEFPKNATFNKKLMYKMALSADYMDDIKYQNKVNNTAFIAGYGYNDYEYNDFLRAQVGLHDGNLRVAKVPLWPSGWCYGVKSKICTTDYSPVAVEGGSGGPLFFKQMHVYNGYYVKAYQFGIIIQTDKISKYNLALPLYPQCGWIETVTNKEANCEIVFPTESRFRRSISSPPNSIMDIKNESMNIPEDKADNNKKDSDNLLASKLDNIAILLLSNLQSTNELKEKYENLKEEFENERGHMESDDDCIFNCIFVILLICLAIFLCYYFFFKDEIAVARRQECLSFFFW